MLVGVDTGYEGKFDFPPRQGPPERTYMLAALPRTGSTYFSHLLWRSGCLGAPLEYLNFEPEGPYYFAAKSRSAQLQLWQSVLRRRISPNGVFGAKCFAGQLDGLKRDNPELLAAVMAILVGEAKPARIVYLDRRHRAALVVSYARAGASGIWRKDQERDGGAQVEYSEAAVERVEQMIEAQSAIWDGLFRELGVEPLRLWYEDVVADPDGAVRQVADFVGVTLDPALQVKVPEVEKQSPGDSAAWAERYAARSKAR